MVVLSAIATLAVTRAASAAGVSDDPFRADVVDCEDAIAALVECCPGFDPSRVRCEYRRETIGSCDASTTQTTTPALSPDESDCIRGARCADLQARGVCARAQLATPYVSSYKVSERYSPEPPVADSRHEAVCP